MTSVNRSTLKLTNLGKPEEVINTMDMDSYGSVYEIEENSESGGKSKRRSRWVWLCGGTNVKNQKKEIDRKKILYDSIQRTNKELSAEVEHLKATADQLRRDADGLRSELSSTIQEKKRTDEVLSEALSSVKAFRLQHNDEMDAMRAQVRCIQTENDQLRAQLEEMRIASVPRDEVQNRETTAKNNITKLTIALKKETEKSILLKDQLSKLKPNNSILEFIKEKDKEKEKEKDIYDIKEKEKEKELIRREPSRERELIHEIEAAKRRNKLAEERLLKEEGKDDMIQEEGRGRGGIETNPQMKQGDIIEAKMKDSEGKIMITKYTRGRFLGKGGFAKCYVATDVTGTSKQYAIKIINKSSLIKSRARQKLQTEIKIQKTLLHHNIVRFEKFFEDHDHAFMLLELCENNSLSDLVRKRKRLTEPEIRFYILQLLDGLEYLHHDCVIHRDIKVGNLFLDANMHVKVGDFGLATRVTHIDERKRTICGTPNYIAPEILEGKNGHSYEVDVWSTGVVLYALLIGKPPYESTDVKATYKRILANQYSFPDNVFASEDAKNLIRSILQTRPERRPSIDEIRRHSFFTHPNSYIPQVIPDSALRKAPIYNSNTNSNAKDIPRLSGAPRSAIWLNKQGPLALSTFKHSLSPPPSKSCSNGTDMNQDELLTVMRSSTIRRGTNSPNTFNSRTESLMDSEMVIKPTDINQFEYVNCNLSSDNTDSEKNSKEIDTLQIVHDALTKHFTTPHDNNSAIKTLINMTDLSYHTAKIWVVRFVDYTSKYGLGYLLNNGSAGAYFNDSSKIVQSPDGSMFQYVERRRIGIENTIQIYEMKSYPVELQKKVTLLRHFRNYLLDAEQRKVQGVVAGEGDDGQPIENFGKHQDMATNPCFLGPAADLFDTSNTLPYLMKWIRSPHAILFRLSSLTVQVVFFDSSEVLLAGDAKTVTYVTKTGARSDHILEDVYLADRYDIAQRLKYTKDIIHRLITSP